MLETANSACNIARLTKVGAWCETGKETRNILLPSCFPVHYHLKHRQHHACLPAMGAYSTQTAKSKSNEQCTEEVPKLKRGAFYAPRTDPAFGVGSGSGVVTSS